MVYNIFIIVLIIDISWPSWFHLTFWYILSGPELDYLELRMLELQGVADLMVVAESSFTFRGDRKPRHFQLNQRRFEERFVVLMACDATENRCLFFNVVTFPYMASFLFF